jgi:DNA repair protein RadA/Sms
MEGTRPILAEVFTLVTPSMFGNAKRTTTGLDFNRASLIMAVLENGQACSPKPRCLP